MLPERDSAPDFELQAFRLSEALKHGPVLVVFFKISCPTCQFALPFLESFSRTGLRLALISQDKPEVTAQFQQRFQITLPVLFDKPWDYTVSNAYRITNVPSFFLVESDSTISRAVNGFSKAFFEELGTRFSVMPFLHPASIPALKPG